MSYELSQAKKKLKDFLLETYIKTPQFFSDAHSDLQNTLKAHLIECSKYCRGDGKAETQRQNFSVLFKNVQQWLTVPSHEFDLLSHANYSEALHTHTQTSSSSSSSTSIETLTIDDFWTSVARLLVADINIPTAGEGEDRAVRDIHKGGYMRGYGPSSDAERLFITILHAQLLGFDLVKTAAKYPDNWQEWSTFISKKMQVLVASLVTPTHGLSLRGQLWLKFFVGVFTVSQALGRGGMTPVETIIDAFFLSMLGKFKPHIADEKTGRLSPSTISQEVKRAFITRSNKTASKPLLDLLAFLLKDILVNVTQLPTMGEQVPPELETLKYVGDNFVALGSGMSDEHRLNYCLGQLALEKPTFSMHAEEVVPDIRASRVLSLPAVNIDALRSSGSKSWKNRQSPVLYPVGTERTPLISNNGSINSDDGTHGLGPDDGCCGCILL